MAKRVRGDDIWTCGGTRWQLSVQVYVYALRVDGQICVCSLKTHLIWLSHDLPQFLSLTSSAGLDEKHLGFILQQWTVCVVKGLKDPVQLKMIKPHTS